MNSEERKRLIELEDKVENCQNNVIKDIEQLKEGHEKLSFAIREQAVERKEYNHKMHDKMDLLSGKISENNKELKTHTDDEMETIQSILDTLETIVTSISSITTKTDDNSDFIDTFKKYWIRITFIGSGVIGTIGAAYVVYSFLQKNGVVFVLEKAGGN